jgi:hypothetical protein
MAKAMNQPYNETAGQGLTKQFMLPEQHRVIATSSHRSIE